MQWYDGFFRGILLCGLAGLFGLPVLAVIQGWEPTDALRRLWPAYLLAAAMAGLGLWWDVK